MVAHRTSFPLSSPPACYSLPCLAISASYLFSLALALKSSITFLNRVTVKSPPSASSAIILREGNHCCDLIQQIPRAFFTFLFHSSFFHLCYWTPPCFSRTALVRTGNKNFISTGHSTSSVKLPWVKFLNPSQNTRILPAWFFCVSW